MMDPQALKLTGLTLQQFLAVVENYGILKEMYPLIIERVKKEVDVGQIKPKANQQIVTSRKWKKHQIGRE